ncbi:MAG: preprotein translocase subunit SecG [Deltaproteobacteria bacterium]|nr:preprotein translocase subunit SecG [Deltaproteobacteria bacterium]
MFKGLIFVISIIGVLMTLIILLQSGKGGGLAGIASGGATTQILGSRQAPDFLERATWILATSFIVLCILTTFTIQPVDQAGSVIQQQAQDGATQQPLAPVLPPPDGGDSGSDQDGGGTVPE